MTTAKVFHAGTALNDAGELVASGGRVLGVTALEADVAKVWCWGCVACGCVVCDFGYLGT